MRLSAPSLGFAGKIGIAGRCFMGAVGLWMNGWGYEVSSQRMYAMSCLGIVLYYWGQFMSRRQG